MRGIRTVGLFLHECYICLVSFLHLAPSVLCPVASVTENSLFEEFLRPRLGSHHRN